MDASRLLGEEHGGRMPWLGILGTVRGLGQERIFARPRQWWGRRAMVVLLLVPLPPLEDVELLEVEGLIPLSRGAVLG